MADTNALTILIDLAQKASDERARQLGSALSRESDNAKRLAMLDDYRRDYLASFERAGKAGLSPAGLMNFHQFLRKLDVAIAQQRQAADHAAHQASSARAALGEAERKRQSLVTLRERRLATGRALEARREQKSHDEIAMQIAVRDIHDSRHR